MPQYPFRHSSWLFSQSFLSLCGTSSQPSSVDSSISPLAASHRSRRKVPFLPGISQATWLFWRLQPPFETVLLSVKGSGNVEKHLIPLANLSRYFLRAIIVISWHLCRYLDWKNANHDKSIIFTASKKNRHFLMTFKGGIQILSKPHRVCRTQAARTQATLGKVEQYLTAK